MYNSSTSPVGDVIWNNLLISSNFIPNYYPTFRSINYQRIGWKMLISYVTKDVKTAAKIKIKIRQKWKPAKRW